MFRAIFSTENLNFVPQNEKSLFAPIDISLAYLVQIRLTTSIYTRFTSFGATHVLRKFQYDKREFRPPKRKKIHLLRLTFL
jgi:hypothetical protein